MSNGMSTFQSYLRTASSPDPHIADTPSASGRTDYSTAGAQHAAAHIDVLGHLLAYSIAGHHNSNPFNLNYAQIHFASVAAFVAGWRSS